MWSAILKLLKNEWSTFLVIAVLLGCGVGFGTYITTGKVSDLKASYEGEMRQQSADFDKQKSQWQDERTGWEKERTASSHKYAADLKAALKQRDDAQAKADALTAQLAKNESDNARRVNDLKRRLKDAIKSDGTAYTGLGPAGLQLWREALGWSAAGGATDNTTGNSVPEATGINAADTGYAASAGGGLSASGIISSSSLYGQWCLTLRDRLQAINNYYR